MRSWLATAPLPNGFNGLEAYLIGQFQRVVSRFDAGSSRSH
jgi:hypothetical protein